MSPITTTLTILKLIQTTMIILLTTTVISITLFFTTIIIFPLGYKFLGPWVRERMGVAHPRYFSGRKLKKGKDKKGLWRDILRRSTIKGDMAGIWGNGIKTNDVYGKRHMREERDKEDYHWWWETV
jgi:hypothetical protein